VIHSNYTSNSKIITDIQFIINDYSLEVERLIDSYRILA